MSVYATSQATKDKRSPEKMLRFLSRRPIYHTMGWLAFFALLVAAQLRTADIGLANALINELINIAFYIVLVYFNLLYLFPNYLRKGSYVLYLGLLLIAAAILTPIKLLAKYIFLGLPPETVLDNMLTYYFSTFLVAGLSTVAKMMTDWFRQNRESQELANETMQSELRFLKSQINPHFLFNTLNSLYALTLKKSDAAPDIVIKLSEMMRYMLYECNEKWVPLKKEIAYIKNYLDLERLRQQKDVEISFSIKGQVVDQEVAPLLFMNFLENSFKHGLNSNITQGYVRIHMEVNQENVHFQIENSKGSAMLTTPDHARPSGGIGLVNARRRLALIYPEQHQLGVQETPNSYTVQLKIQLSSKR